jgi:UDP-N-acetylmuramoyl-L-alanyl-D-glutamate--2,6-diaminopimelate ligase
MPRKRLSTLLESVDVLRRTGREDPYIDAICYDSRSAQPGSVFVALPGFHVDGHDYIDDALSRGAVAVVAEREETAARFAAGSTGAEHPRRAGPVAVLVESSRVALSRLSATFYDHPSKDLFVIGVTGTDGKSSTVSFIEQILSFAGEPTGLISTVNVKTGDTIRKNPERQSTPEAVELHGYLDEMRRSGRRYAVVEATSHGLSARTSRLADVVFHAAVFTNLSHEHLEFHGSFEQYRSDKGNLFRALDSAGRSAFGVVNAGDANGEWMAAVTSRAVFRYAASGGQSGPPIDLAARDIAPGLDGTEFTLFDASGESRRLRLPLPGAFQVENVLAALLAASRATSRSEFELADAVAHLVAVEGRLVPVGENLPFAVVVDYAHTPNSFEKLFPIIRASTPGRIIAVFGSAGERDLAKRRLQGAVAARHVELIVLCDEDPRGEDPEAILEEIAAGVREADPERTEGEGYLIIPDRRTAIRAAIDSARPGDTVVLLGKGHESSIIYADGPHPWNEAEVARQVLAEAGYEHQSEEAAT